MKIGNPAPRSILSYLFNPQWKYKVPTLYHFTDGPGFKNNALTFVELEMKAAGILDYATDLHNPDFAKIAEAAGLLGLTAEIPPSRRSACPEVGAMQLIRM